MTDQIEAVDRRGQVIAHNLLRLPRRCEAEDENRGTDALPTERDGLAKTRRREVIRAVEKCRARGADGAMAIGICLEHRHQRGRARDLLQTTDVLADGRQVDLHPGWSLPREKNTPLPARILANEQIGSVP